ncbi:MAG: ribosomal-processing cysteine protease Prp [Eubacteriales bacterium]|nr:ribosomal-processing cysteine protease Prp [Eubacteriales bacterium]MDD3882151.1 ribosomal-processing cysteine protease Prp [Eubacteriales bacterium]MDD4513256.1 ribosomal-processing cysteine protease Prp [Eubacteriales bacterium]
MITFTCCRDENGRALGFECSGHSGYKSAGSDIVCSAVSVLTQTLVNTAEAQLQIVMDVTVDDAKGFLRAILPKALDSKQESGFKLLMAYLLTGVRSIADEYPKYVRYTESII